MIIHFLLIGGGAGTTIGNEKAQSLSTKYSQPIEKGQQLRGS